jgi:hypothetical protein
VVCCYRVDAVRLSNSRGDSTATFSNADNLTHFARESDAGDEAYPFSAFLIHLAERSLPYLFIISDIGVSHFNQSGPEQALETLRYC